MQLIDLEYKMGAQPLFQRLNVKFIAGIIAIVGANGCGKTTLLRILCGLCQPHSGKVLIEDQDLYEAPQLKNIIGYVPTTPFLYPHLTVLENIRFCAKIKKVSKKAFISNITKVLQQCDLMDYQKVLFSKLSDGLKKRAMIASQLIHQPSILILDEPCAALDPYQRQQVWGLFQQLQSMNKLILFSSHHPQEIAPICNDMYQLSQGHLDLLPKHANHSQVLWQPSPSSKVTPTLEAVCA